MPPGMFLSHPPMTTTPSIHCPCAAVSMQSAMTSRDTSEYFMPSVPMDMPSEIVGVPNTWGLARETRMASIAASARRCSPLLHGVIVECPLATPIIGFWKSASV
ncbi:Uncharacterised protein [Bordetella pertussis]|nr:Uncharacterised protein [Bordetella pertussis]